MDNRREPRISHHIRFFVHVFECEEDPDLVGLSVACHALDFSSRGLQFETELRLEPHSLLNITIGIGEPFAMFLLRGEIRWIKNVEDKFNLGILLRDEAKTDYQKWVSEFDSIFYPKITQ